MTLETQEIIYKKTKSRQLHSQPQSLCDIFSYQPDNIEQMPLGNLYLIGELDCIKDCTHLNDLLTSIIKREYYLYPARGPFKSFQAAIKKANLHLADSAKHGNDEWLGKLHFAALVVAQDNLFITQAGLTKIFLSRQTYFTSLSKKIVPEPERPHPSKTFSSIISGKVETGDRIVMATSKMDELFSSSGLKQILINHQNLPDAAEQLNKILREAPAPPGIAILLINVGLEEITKKESRPKEMTPKNITPPIDLKEILK